MKEKYSNPSTEKMQEQNKNNYIFSNRKDGNIIHGKKYLKKMFKKELATISPININANTLDKPPENLENANEKRLIQIPLKFKNN